MLLKLLKQATKVSNKVKSKIRTRENGVGGEGGSGESHHSEHGFSDYGHSDQREDGGNSSGASTPAGEVPPTPFGSFTHAEERSQGKTMRNSGDESEEKPIHKIITSKAEAWIQKKTMSWPWKANDREESESKNVRVSWPWLQGDQEKESTNHKNPSSGLKPPESRAVESHQHVQNEASGGSWSSFNVNSTSSTSSCGSGSGSSSAPNNRVDVDSDCLDYEILWEDLTIGENIGQGSNVLN
jgi:hypothetical protein